ncbi:MAG TPA: FtsX-like permease family protein [Ktedonosporobacter sp.]|jgi:putative ABC transport system permease protein|nr:FtsX-like permease family protein [Ktedonosporobacter sp.]
MIELFGIPIDTLTLLLGIITTVIIVVVALLALFNAIFFKIGVRNIPRRRMQMVLIVFALMLSTTLLSSVLATGDVLTATVQSVAVYNWGGIDELIEGGRGPLGLFRDEVYYGLVDRARNYPDIMAVGAALQEHDLLVADQTSRQVRSAVTGLAVIPGSEKGFGGMQDTATRQTLTIAALKPDQVYLNQTVAQLLNAHAGDTLYLYSSRWPGRRYTLSVAAIVNNGGLVGDNPTLLSQLQTFHTIEGLDDEINEVYIANRGSGLSGLSLSDQVSQTIRHWFPRVNVIQVKVQGVQNSQKAQDIFSRVFALFSLFALAIGLLLIFLIFVLLAAERRTEMGMARAIGVQRRHLIFMFLFEGTVYDLLASFVGLLFGIGAGYLLITLLGPVLARFNFPLTVTFQPRSMIIAYCLGVIFTFFAVALSSWLVSRMTVVEAIRDLSETGHSTLSLGEIGVRLLQVLGIVGRNERKAAAPAAKRMAVRRSLRRLRRILFELIPDIFVSLVRELVRMGFLPLLAGLLLMQMGLENTQVIPFSLGLSLIVIGGGLLVKALIEQIMLFINWRRNGGSSMERRNATAGLFAFLVGLPIVAYWALPFDVVGNLGLPRFQGGIEVFFVAAMMMVLGAAWVIIMNAKMLLSPLFTFCARIPGASAVARLALAYPLHRRFRTGLSMVMFSLVVFSMTVMAVITNAMQNSYVDINTQTGGYDIQATAFFKSIPDIRSSLVQHGIDPQDFSAIGVRSTTAVGVIQLSSDAPRWTTYPAQIVSGGFLQGYGLHLKARANGFASDNAVWQALQTHPDYALIDSSALPFNPNVALNTSVYDPSTPAAADVGAPATPPNFDPRLTFSLSGVYQGDTVFAPTPIWVTSLQGREAIKLTIIGVVDNSDSAHFGLYIPRSNYSLAGVGTVDNVSSEPQTYYFKVAPGQDKRALSLALGSAYLDDGLETTVLEDAIWQVRGPRILLSNVLLGIVGMVLLLGVAALAITGTRAVVERRQQIGMLRALGCSRRLIQSVFLLESFLVGALGSVLGVILGLILARNIFAANFFEQYQTGLLFSVPWQEIGLIIGVAFLASFLGALLPSWQAGKVAPAEALRYI